MPRSFSEEFKKSIVRKILMPNGPSITEISKELGVHHTSIRRWKQLYDMTTSMKKINKWTPKEKLKAVAETISLTDNKLGEYLRKHGLHSNDIEQWKEEFLNAQKSLGRPKKDPELSKAQSKNKELERELRRKDKALAEMSARIVLLKKSHLIWGETEDDE